MKLLLVNPNMTQAVTEKVVAEARRCAASGTTVQGVTATFGVAIVSTEAEVAVAAHAALDLLAAHHVGYDAAIVAMSFDAGVLAARSLMPIPVLGITEAAIHTACLLARRFGIIIAGAVSMPLHLDLIDASGLRGRMCAMEVVEVGSVTAYLDTEALEVRLLDAARRLSERPEIEAIIFCGAAVAGIAHRLQPQVPLPLIDGVAAATAQAELLVNLKLRPKDRPRALAAGLVPTGLSTALQQLLIGTSAP
jgi:allantoin racemase